MSFSGVCRRTKLTQLIIKNFGLKSSPYNSGQIVGLGYFIEKIDREQRRQRLVLAESSLNTWDVDSFDSKLVPGSPSVDAPVILNGEESWFLKSMGKEFTGVYFVKTGEETPAGATGLA